MEQKKEFPGQSEKAEKNEISGNHRESIREYKIKKLNSSEDSC